MSAKKKLLSYIGSLFAVAILIVSISGYFNFKSASVENSTERLNSESFLISQALDQHVQRYFDSLAILGTGLEITTDGVAEADREVIVNKLKNVKDYLDVIATVTALKDGTSFISTGQIIDRNERAFGREWYSRIFAGEEKIITKPYTTASGDFVMALAVPVKRDNTIVATLLVNMKVIGITEFVSSLTNSQQLVVSRPDGFILASPNAEDIGSNLFELEPSYEAYSGQDSSQHTYDQNGEQYVVNSTKIASLGWTVWASEKTSAINSASNSNLIQGLVLALILILVSLGIIYISVNKLMYKPIGGEPKEIEELVTRIANGDLSLQATVSGNETGIYAATILMITNLKTIIGDINTATSELTTSSEKIASSASKNHSSSEQQMNQLDLTATAMQEMTMTVEEVARNAQNASTAAKEASQLSVDGIQSVQDMNDHISKLVLGIENVMIVITKLEKETQGIGSILEVINSISEQTNLLALNAAIEAARAGEHGRGFAVVADEVRNLANRTKESTNEIQEVIKNLQEEAQRSAQLMNTNVDGAKETATKSEEASKTLLSIKDAITTIDDMNAQIATSADEQTHVATEINISIVEVNDLAKTTFENSNNNKGMAIKLTDVASTLDESVDAFKL